MPHFTTTRRVQFAETDMAGIVHFANFYRYMEEAEHEFFRSLGLSISSPQADGSVISWPRVAASCSFDAPAFFEDVLEIELTVARIGTRSLTLHFEFRRGDTLIATGEIKTVCCRWKPGDPLQSVAIPPEYRSKLEAT
jgi:YbgC/YbaW family acyl-CoA thioester hydrolase